MTLNSDDYERKKDNFDRDRGSGGGNVNVNGNGSGHYYGSLQSKIGSKNYVPGFVGLEYECNKGHRHIMDVLTMSELINWNYNDLNSIFKCYNITQSNINYKEESSNLDARITGSIFPNYDLPIRVPCYVCKEKNYYNSSKNFGNDNIFTAQLSRIHIVTPPAPIAVTLNPRVQVKYLYIK